MARKLGIERGSKESRFSSYFAPITIATTGFAMLGFTLSGAIGKVDAEEQSSAHRELVEDCIDDSGLSAEACGYIVDLAAESDSFNGQNGLLLLGGALVVSGVALGCSQVALDRIDQSTEDTYSPSAIR